MQFLAKYPESKTLPLLTVNANNKLFTADELKQYFYQMDSIYKNNELVIPRLDIINKNHLSEIGAVLPDITANTPDSIPFSISSLKGKYVFIDFWASWCKPCRAENPLLRKLYETYREKNFEIVSFSLDDNAGKWKDAIEKDAMNWHHISDLNGWKKKDGIDDTFGIYSIPSNYLIDPNGIVVDKNLRGMLLEKRLKEIFEQ
jgi:thiol-disulfide isomerase/thioredoxin